MFVEQVPEPFHLQPIRGMFPSSLSVILAGLLIGASALAAFAWAWRHGQLDVADAQAAVILDPRDLRLERPWETPLQRAERERRHGPPAAAVPSDWGAAR
jgi:nitrogen fixation-related uncharacterized protein